MRKYFQFWVTCLVMLPVFLWGGGKSVAKPLEAPTADAYQVIDLVNQVRSGYGLPPLEANAALMAAAQGHSEYQASIGSTTHTGAAGSRPVDRAVAAGYGAGAKVYISENIYGGSKASPQQAVNWWKGDPPHLSTMINASARDIGAGVASSGNTVYYTLDVGYVSGSPASGYTPPPSSGSAATGQPGATSGPTAVVIIPVQAATPGPDGSIVHIVRQGQALWNIAAIYKISLAELMSLNGLNQNSLIHPGDRILVKSADKSAPSVTPELAGAATGTPKSGMEAPFLTPTQEMAIAPSVNPSVAQTFSPANSVLELKTPGSEDSPSAKQDVDFVVVGIVGLIILGTTLILVGSMTKRSL